MSLSKQAALEFGQSASTNEPQVNPKVFFGKRQEYVRYTFTSENIAITDVDFGKTIVVVHPSGSGGLTLPPAAISTGGHLWIVYRSNINDSTLSASAGETLATSITYNNDPLPSDDPILSFVINITSNTATFRGSITRFGHIQLYCFCDGTRWYVRGTCLQNVS